MADLVRDVVLAPDTVTNAEDTLSNLRGMYQAARADLEGFPTDARGSELRRKVDQAQADAAPLIDSLLGMVAAQQSAEARTFLNEQVLPKIHAWREPIRENLILQTAKNEADHADAVAAYSSARTSMQALGALALAIGALLAWLITRSLTTPLQEATRVARDIARGSLDSAIDPRGNDELATLLQSMHDMQAELKAFVEAQGEIAHQHDLGETEHRMPADRFPGAYGQMAGQVNALAASHIQLLHEVSVLIDEYARGDLRRDMPRLPGRKADISRAMDAVKTNIEAATGELDRLVRAAVAGDFAQRGDAGRFEFVYRGMIEQLNTLMSSAGRGLDEVGSVLTAVSE